MQNKKLTIWSDTHFFKHEHHLSHYYTHYNCTVELHAHSFYEVNIICDGTGIHSVNNMNISVKKGNVFIIPPNTPHSYKNHSNLTVRHILINDKFFSYYEKELSLLKNYSTLFMSDSFLPYNNDNPSLFLTEKDFETFNCFWDASNKLHAEEKNNPPLKEANVLIYNALTLSIISYFCSLYKTATVSPQKESPYTSSIALAIKHITEHYNEKLTIEELSSICAMSKSTFVRTFKKFFRTTPATYITNQRISHAKILLKNSSFSIVQIAQETGFFDSAHFTKTFKKTVGILPLEFKKSQVQ